MKRREFITLGGAFAAWPMAARAQQPERVLRIGVLMALPANDAEVQARVAAFLQGLQGLGWSVGHNVIVDIRWSTGSNADTRKYAIRCPHLRSLMGQSGQAAGGQINCKRSNLFKPHSMDAVATVEWVLCWSGFVSECPTVYFNKPDLLCALPSFVPTHIDLMNDPVVFNRIGSCIGNHRIVETDFFFRHRNKRFWHGAVLVKN
jgi:hypothetical protein